MNWDFIREYYPLYIEAMKLTISVALISIVFAVLIGLLIGMIDYYKIPILKNVCQMYIEVSRNTPLLIQLFFLYFGLPKIGIVLSSMQCAIIGLTFQGGSYMANAFKVGLDNIKVTQNEVALSLGMTQVEAFVHVILPQGIITSIPAICANVIFMIKETSTFSAVALADLMYVAKDLIGMYYNTTEALTLLVISYLIILLPISIIFTIVERRVRYATFGN